MQIQKLNNLDELTRLVLVAQDLIEPRKIHSLAYIGNGIVEDSERNIFENEVSVAYKQDRVEVSFSIAGNQYTIKFGINKINQMRRGAQSILNVSLSDYSLGVPLQDSEEDMQ